MVLNSYILLSPFCVLQQQKRQQKLDSRVTLDSLTSPTHTETNQNDITGALKPGENTDTDMRQEASPSEENPAQISVSEQDQNNVQDSEDNEGDMDSNAESSSVSNRFTVLSEEQKSNDSIRDDDKASDVEQEEEEDDTELVDKMEKVNLDEAFVEDSDAREPALESEEELTEAKEYTVVNQDPEMAFQTLATRTAPEKQECSVKSCLFQFTEVEMLTQSNSLLCVACNKRQQNKDKAQGIGSYSLSCRFNFFYIAQTWHQRSSNSNKAKGHPCSVFFLICSFCPHK